ncbi:unnamed protein product [Spodoptera exigua]|nr:unnamed protein product [Spodoptera exigua]
MLSKIGYDTGRDNELRGDGVYKRVLGGRETEYPQPSRRHTSLQPGNAFVNWGGAVWVVVAVVERQNQGRAARGGDERPGGMLRARDAQIDISRRPATPR